MTLTFADTHNMIVYLTKSDASEGLNQIIDFLYGSSIKYALTVNPNIYVSCIKQFWTSVAVKKVNDITRFQALVDKKKVVITKATIRDALRLDDAEGFDCLPNEEIFAELARMGFEKPSTKLTFYKAFFSTVICISTSRKFNFSKYIIDSLVRNVDSPTKFYMYPRFLQLMIRKQVGDLSCYKTKYSSLILTQKVFANMRRVGKGCSGVETPLFEGMIVEQQVGEGAAEVNVEDVSTTGVATEGAVSVADDEVPTAVDEPSIPSPTPPTPPPQPSQDQPSTSQIAQAMEITKLKQREKKLERRNKASKLQILKKVGIAQRIETSDDTVMDDVSKQGRMIADMDADDEDVDIEPVELQEVVKVVTTAKILTEDEAYARELEAELNKNIDWDEVIDHVQRKQKEDNAVKRYQALKRKPQTEAQAKKNMIIYLRNVAGFKMYYFQEMTYDDIRLIFEKYFNSNEAFLQKTKEQMEEEDSRALKRLSESKKDKAAKKQKLDEEVEELKRHLMIVPNDDDDVYTEATPLALKVPVVDYEIYTKNNKPYYKIKRADGSHQPYMSFLSMLRNFDREDLEPDIQAQIWKNQRSVHGQAKVKSWKLLESCGVQIITFTTTQLILLVERKYPLTKFTLDQMLNNVRLEVEEESEVSLELLSFGFDAAEEFKEYMLSDYCCQVKLMLLINAAKLN
nr:hypothetical protein [Tanacetum cinerariifolium]